MAAGTDLGSEAEAFAIAVSGHGPRGARQGLPATGTLLSEAPNSAERLQAAHELSMSRALRCARQRRSAQKKHRARVRLGGAAGAGAPGRPSDRSAFSSSAPNVNRNATLLIPRSLRELGSHSLFHNAL